MQRCFDSLNLNENDNRNKLEVHNCPDYHNDIVTSLHYDIDEWFDKDLLERHATL